MYVCYERILSYFKSLSLMLQVVDIIIINIIYTKKNVFCTVYNSPVCEILLVHANNEEYSEIHRYSDVTLTSTHTHTTPQE